jgi:hypothetical protein
MTNRKRHLRRQIREIRREMKEKGIRRISCFNGGHTSESYRLNAKMFELETRLKAAKEDKHESA